MQSAQKSQKTILASDNLELANVVVPEIPKDILFPDELNRYLRDQVQYLTHENGMLCKNLSEVELQIKQSESKIATLTCQLDEYQTACPKNSLASSATALAGSKIVELSKKLRERNSEVEVYKTRCSKLEKYIFELERDKNKNDEPIPTTDKPKNEGEEQIKTLQDKLNSTNMKLCEARNLNVQLKNDLKLANKLLVQEVGENFENLQSNANANWRGRSQIICDLQQKNNDLKVKLKAYQEKDRSRTNFETSTQITKQDKRLDNLIRENTELKDVLQSNKRKLECVKARNKVLESESSVLRTKLSAINEQSDHDHELIASLTTKVAHAQEQQNNAVHQKQVILQKIKLENKHLHMEVAKQKCKMDNLNAQLEDQRREIENLREKFRKQQPLTPPKADIDTKTLNLLETERLRLLELTKLSNERLESERTTHAATQAKFRSERQKAAKLEAKLARLELEQQTNQSSTYSITSLKSKDSDDTTLADRLQLAEETIKALETRLQIKQQEHKTDIEEFTKILRNYGYIENISHNFIYDKQIVYNY